MKVSLHTMSEDTTTVTVIVSANNYRRCYHTDADNCQSVTADHETEQIPKSKAERLGLDLCSWCDGRVQTDTQDMSYFKAAKNADLEELRG